MAKEITQLRDSSKRKIITASQAEDISESNKQIPSYTQKVAGSIPDGVIDLNLPAALWPLESTQHLTDMSTKYVSWGVNAAGAYRLHIQS